MTVSIKILRDLFGPGRTFTILYGPGETLQDAIIAAGIYPDAWDSIVGVSSNCDDIPAEARLIAVERGELLFCRAMHASETVH